MKSFNDYVSERDLQEGWAQKAIGTALLAAPFLTGCSGPTCPATPQATQSHEMGSSLGPYHQKKFAREREERERKKTQLRQQGTFRHGQLEPQSVTSPDADDFFK